MIQEIFKGKGDPSQPKSSRDIKLLDNDFKFISKSVRLLISPNLQSFAFSWTGLDLLNRTGRDLSSTGSWDLQLVCPVD